MASRSTRPEPSARAPRELLRTLAERRPLLLDGATGTELEKRGLRSTLPLWSTHALLEAPEEVQAVHRDYCDCGAELITANTFRTQRRTLARAGIGERDAELTTLAVDLARRAALASAASTGRPAAWVLGSAPPLEDCYRPDLVPDDRALRAEHARHAELLASAGVDGILIETIGTLREARAALRAALGTGLPTLLSFAATLDSQGRARLLSGEALRDAVELGASLGADALLVNCLPLPTVDACIEALSAASLPFGAYPNQAAALPVGGLAASSEAGAITGEIPPSFDQGVAPEAFAARAAGWIERGATIVGGCCGMGPAHLRALAERLH